MSGQLNVKDFGAVGNGVVNDTTSVQAAIDAAAVSGGRIAFPAGTYLCGTLTLKSNVWLEGSGIGTTFIKLVNGTNNDLIVTNGFSGLTGGTTTGGVYGFRIANLTLDGNRANNSAGWPLRIYGSTYTIDNVHIKEGKSGGVWTQWGIGGTNMDSMWSNFKIYNCEGVVFDFGGPHDSLISNGQIFNDGTQADRTGKLLYIHGQASGTQFNNCHFWGNCAFAVDNIGGNFFNNCQAEGAATANVRFQANYASWNGGHIFGTTASGEIGIQLGLTAVTSAKGCSFTNVMLSKFGAGAFPIKFDNSAGSNVITGEIGVTVTAASLYTGTPFTVVGEEDRMDIRSASPVGLATSWAVPKIQSSIEIIPSHMMEAVSGTPSKSTTQQVPVWHFDASAIEMVGTVYVLPAWWNTVSVTLIWANSSTGAGDAKWTFRYDFIDAGQTLGTYSSLFNNGVTAGAIDVAVYQTQSGTLTNIAGKPFLMRIERNATDALDTLVNDAYLIGVQFNRVS
jgi:hypothetical protein